MIESWTTQIKLKRRMSAILLVAMSCNGDCSCGEPESRQSTGTHGVDFEKLDVSEAERRLRENATTDRYRAADGPRRAAIRELFEVLAEQSTSDQPPVLDPLADRAGLRAEFWNIDDQQYLTLLEQPEFTGMMGAFVVRLGPNPGHDELILQAPHSFFDLRTGSIATHAFFASNTSARALFINTLHRYVHEDGEKEEREHNPADVCHHEDHPFSAATEGFVRGSDGSVVVQVHGFGSSTEIEGTPDAAVIVSAGRKSGSTNLSNALADSLRANLEVPVARFPEDTSTLGATTNVQKHLLDRHDSTRFVHLELSATLRKRLQQDGSDFASALIEVMRRGAPKG